MTEKQLDAIKRLAERHGSSLEHTVVIQDTDGIGICGLPADWALVTVYADLPEGTDPLVTGGVCPDGRVST